MRSEVLIIGAGPSGLFAAAELTRHGIAVRLVEREGRPHHEARATAIQAGTLEILASVGLLPPFIASAEHVRRTRIYGSDMCELRATTFEGIDCRCEFQCTLPQYQTERILEEHLRSLGGTVERGVTATKVEPGADRVRVFLLHADGSVETTHPEVVIGAGGAHDVTRASMNEPLDGATYEGHFLVADIAMQAPLPRDECSIVCGPNGLLFAFAAPGRTLDQLPGSRRSGADNIERRGRRPRRGSARHLMSAHRRCLVFAVSDAPADRRAFGRRPALPDR